MTVVTIALLGGFGVRVDGCPVPETAWTRRSASSLVKLLALAPQRSLHREQVLDALWPDLQAAEAQPRLHTAAHYARRALGERSAVVLRGDVLTLLPEGDVEIDVENFSRLARVAVQSRAPQDVDAALAAYDGPLLPQDVFEPWTESDRERVRQLHQDVLRAGERWDDLLLVEPADEQAHLELMRSYAEKGDRRGTLRQFERLERTLRAELGVGPGADAVALRDRMLATMPATPAQRPGTTAAPDAPRLVGRRPVLQRLDAAIGQAGNGRGSTLLVSGPAGVGTSAVLRWTRSRARAAGVRVGAGVAAAVEGAWPYAPVLEALADLARQHPTLLDGLDDAYREEIERALRGGELSWSGEGGHQRLFVSVAELVRLAATGAGAVLTVDDLHEADDASLRLLHYLARAASTEHVVLVVGHRNAEQGSRLDRFRTSLLHRQAAVDVRLSPLPSAGTAALLADRLGAPPAPELVEQVHLASGGLPMRVLELTRTLGRDGQQQLSAEALLRRCPHGTEDVLRRAALAGSAFDTDLLVALSGTDDETAFAMLDAVLAAGLLEVANNGYRFRGGALREALLADVPPHRLRRLHRDVAQALLITGGAPAAIGQHLLRAGEPRAAAPHLLRAAETAAALGAHRDALDLVEQIDDVAEEEQARLLSLRADLLFAVGDPGVVTAFRAAAQVADPVDRRRVLARLAQAAMLYGDRETAVDVLSGLELDGGPADTAILLARGNVAYFDGDLEAARAAADEARDRLDGASDWRLLDLIALQGMIAHNRGEWFQRLRHELQRTREAPEIATAVFDAHLCVAEYLLYGPMPYSEVLQLGAELRAAAQRAGALRAVAFALALSGEAALLSGDLAAAERDLLEAVDLHAEIEATAGEAHSLQRLAEVRVHQGDRAEARRLLQRALPLARWSPLALHLLQRIHGTMIAATESVADAYAAAERAEAAVGSDDACRFCQVMVSVPSAIACADAGDLEAAGRHLAAAEQSATLWEGTAWQAAVLEARAHLATANGDAETAQRLLKEAAGQFAAAGQPLDADRCCGGICTPVTVPAPRAEEQLPVP